MFSQHIPHQSSSADDSLRPSQHPAKHYNNVTPTFAHNSRPRVYITPPKKHKTNNHLPKYDQCPIQKGKGSAKEKSNK